eukprot:6759302-Alexandrium_andersonii.AAC.1
MGRPRISPGTTWWGLRPNSWVAVFSRRIPIRRGGARDGAPRCARPSRGGCCAHCARSATRCTS